MPRELWPHEHHIAELGGLPVVEFPGYDTVDHGYRALVRSGRPVPDPYPPHARLAAATAAPGTVAWRLRLDSDIDLGLREAQQERFHQYQRVEDAGAYIARFGEEVALEQVAALVVADLADDEPTTDPDRVFASLLALAPRLTGLRHLFYGDVLQRQNEISWIHHTDLGPLVGALPSLEELTVRGGTGDLGLNVERHERLRVLAVQSGALRTEVVRQVCAADLPALRRLELWTGVEEYGGETGPEDLEPLLSGRAFPALRHLGLRNTEHLDGWVPVLAGTPVLARLETLDLSLGDLSDAGGLALIEHADAFTHLERLDLHHHYLSEEVREGVRAALPGVEIDLSHPREPEERDGGLHRYTVVAE
ncbi:hypothetical protein SUDANB121_03949 [Nocardiopsis dassonvillei]|uniref:STM4015 family protein n=1 Tax=Nocardiopsis dassonvillei TaxID=2014 RepID=UPI003F55A581